MEEPALDFLVFIILLAVVSSLALVLIVPITKESNELAYSEQYDKSASKVYGEIVDEDTDTKLSITDIVLTAMCQTCFLGEPGVLDICGRKIEIDNNIAYDRYAKSTGDTVYTVINQWFEAFKETDTYKNKLNAPPSNIADARFNILYYAGDTKTTADDTYALYIYVYLKSSPDKESICICLADGLIADEAGNII